MASKLVAAMSGWDNNTWDIQNWYKDWYACVIGRPPPMRGGGPYAEVARRQYRPDPPPADRYPRPCSGSASCCSRCWRWRRAIRSASWRPIPPCRPRCGAALRAKFGLDDPVWLPLPALARRHAAGRLGLLVREPHGRRHADPAAPADDAVRDRRRAAPRHPGGAAGRRAGGDQALFGVRPDRQHARLSSASRCRPSSPACC